MEKEVKVYVLQWHNYKNFTDEYFAEDFISAKQKFDSCNSKESFDTLLLIEATFKSNKEIYNKDYLVSSVLRGYNLMPQVQKNVLFAKEISNMGVAPLPDTGDLCDLIDHLK